MRGSKEDLTVAAEGEGFVSRQAEWGEVNVAIGSMPGGLDTAPLFEGLSDDRCRCPHWGYVLKGRMHIRYPERDEVIEAGDAYYMELGCLDALRGGLRGGGVQPQGRGPEDPGDRRAQHGCRAEESK